MVNVNHFSGLTDNEVIEKAIAARDADGMVVIPPRESATEPHRDWWLLDRAILIPEHTTILLQNCRIKLSDRCRDNFFRSANCGIGLPDPAPIRDIHLRGEGLCILEGADHPRATGDGGKILADPCPYLPEDLCKYAPWVSEERKKAGKPTWNDMHDHSFGTDAKVEGESHYGDWRGIGVLLANVTDFSIENLHIADSHGWGISLEACSEGVIRNIDFSACMSVEVDGMLQNTENQDGIDIRNGCHHITISDITGHTGDDVVALTAIVPDKWEFKPGGSMRSTHVMPNNWDVRDRDIHHVTIRNVAAYSQLCWVVRLLPCNSHIHHITIENILDTAPSLAPSRDYNKGCLLLGEGDTAYGKNLPDGLTNVTVSGVTCHRGNAIDVPGYLKDSTIRKITNRGTGGTILRHRREDALQNVTFQDLTCKSDTPVTKL